MEVRNNRKPEQVSVYVEIWLINLTFISRRAQHETKVRGEKIEEHDTVLESWNWERVKIIMF